MPHYEETNGHAPAPARRGVYLLTHPRSASNLFQKMMEKQPGVQNSSYHFFEAAIPIFIQLQARPINQWPAAELEALYDAALGKMKAELEDAEKKGLQVFIKEHTSMLTDIRELFGDEQPSTPLHLRPQQTNTNPTFLPDDMLLAMQPVFQIRHPVLMFPSFLRAQTKVMGRVHPKTPTISAILTLRFSRRLYDWYASHPSALPPKVIDADDIMNNPSAVRQLCVEVDLDPEAVQYEWETPPEETDPRKAAFLSTINGSNGIKKGLDARNIDVEEEKVKWAAEFGEEDAEDMAKFVYDAIPDYEYLLKRRVKGAAQ
ncbi:hypothetical protein Q7P37_011600 [Cladosporium fusiforme]